MPTPEELAMLEEGPPSPPPAAVAPPAAPAAPGRDEQILEELYRLYQQQFTPPPAPRNIGIGEGLGLARLGMDPRTADIYKSEIAKRDEYPDKVRAERQAFEQRRIGQGKDLYNVYKGEKETAASKKESENSIGGMLEMMPDGWQSGLDELEALRGDVPDKILNSIIAEFKSGQSRVKAALEKYRSTGKPPSERELDYMVDQLNQSRTGLDQLRTLGGSLAEKAAAGGGDGPQMPAGLVTESALAQSMIAGLGELDNWIAQNPGVGGSFQMIPFRKAFADRNSPLGAFADLVGFGENARKQVDAEGSMSLLSSMMMNKLSGAAISAQEMERLRLFLPDIAGGDFSNRQNIRRLMTFLERNLSVIQARGQMIQSLQAKGMTYEQAKMTVVPDFGPSDPSLQLRWDSFPQGAPVPEGFSGVNTIELPEGGPPVVAAPVGFDPNAPRAGRYGVPGISSVSRTVAPGRPEDEPGSIQSYLRQGKSMSEAKRLAAEERARKRQPGRGY